MKRDLVVFAEDFGRHPASTEHLVRRLARDRKVLWMNSIGMRRPRLTAADARRAVRKLAALASRQTDVPASAKAPAPANLTVVAPRAIPAPGSKLVYRLNRALLSRQVREQMTGAGMEAPILWLTLPSALPVAGAIGEHALVYYCGDDFGALAGVDHAAVTTMEREVVARAKLIIACSEALAAKFPAEKTLLVPHGVDYDIFARPAARPADLPTRRKIAGFYGSLPHWVDAGLVAHTAARLPDWLFVFVGAGHLFAPGEAPANVLFLGPRAHYDLPGYVQHWNVSMLPYRDCPALRAGNPLKLREYLAAGTPIASVDFPALAPYRDLVSLAGSPGDFADAIVRAAADSARNVSRRRAVVGGTWEARAAEVDAALEAL